MRSFLKGRLFSLADDWILLKNSLEGPGCKGMEFLIDEEAEIDIQFRARPIRNLTGDAVAAVNIAIPANRVP